MAEVPLLVCASAFSQRLRGAVVAAAIGRGLERGGLLPPDLLAVCEGGPGLVEALLLGMGGESRDGFALVDGGGTAVTEGDGAAVTAAALAEGAQVLVVADGAPAPARAPRGLAVVRLSTRRGERGREWGAGFVLDALEYDARMRAARAVVVAAPALGPATLDPDVTGEMATRARQAGVPCHAICARDGLGAFGARIVDLQNVLLAGDEAALEDAGERLAALL